MKKSGQCPKCNSLDLGVFPEVGLNMNLKVGGVANTGMFEVYSCGECGYTELFLVPPLRKREAEGLCPVDERDCKFRWLNPRVDPQGPFR
jgi:predicted nucleic-acid-binding Zn-ribbon protein